MSLSLEFEDQLALVSGADISNVLISHKGSENGYMCVEMETPTNPQHMKLLAVRLVSRGDAFKVKEVIGVGKSTRVTVELGRTSVADAVVHFWCLFGKKKNFHLQDASDELVTRLTTQAGQATLAEPPEGYPDIELCLNVTTNTDLKQSSLVLFMQALHPRNLSLKTSPRCPPLVDPSFLMSASVQRLTMLHLDVVPPIVTEENFKQLPQSRLNLGKQAATPLSATTLNRVLRDIQEGSAAEGASLLSRHLLELHLALADDVDWGVVVDGLNANVEPLDRGVSFSCSGGRRCVVSFDVDVDGMTLLHVGVILPEQPGHAHTYRVPDNCPVQ